MALLPSGYTQLEYIASTGTQYIDTGFIANQNTRLDMVAVPSSVEEAAAGIGFIPYGAGNSYNSAAFECYTSGSKYEFNFGTQNTFIGSPAVGQKLTISHNKNAVSLTVNDDAPITATLTANTFTTPRNLILFGINRSAPLLGLLRLYSCQIYDNGTLVRDFVPCINASSELGLWDNVNSQFYSNAGSGDFIGSSLPIKSIKTGTILDFPYAGFGQEVTLPAGKYKLQCWGAQGGSYSTYYGGRGGYSEGILTLTERSNTLYVYTGSQPASSDEALVNGGFNGGGKAKPHKSGLTSTYAQAGGGGTDIRIGQDSLYARVIVAGGGGGSASVDAATTKYGGGLTGGSPTSGYEATQTAAGTAGAFGQGADANTGSGYSASGGGGGGWYGGGAQASSSNSTATRNQNGGGSGYVYTLSTASNYPSGCLLNEAYYLTEAETYAGNTEFSSTLGRTDTEVGHSGNGYARITAIEVNGFSIPVRVENEWKMATSGFVKINSAWKKVACGFVKVNGVWKKLASAELPPPPILNGTADLMKF